MSLKLEKVGTEETFVILQSQVPPEVEVQQQQLEPLNVSNNDGYERDVENDVRQDQGGEFTDVDGQEHKPALEDDDNDRCSEKSEKRWNDETTCHSGDGIREIGSNV